MTVSGDRRIGIYASMHPQIFQPSWRISYTDFHRERSPSWDGTYYQLRREIQPRCLVTLSGSAPHGRPQLEVCRAILSHRVSPCAELERYTKHIRRLFVPYTVYNPDHSDQGESRGLQAKKSYKNRAID